MALWRYLIKKIIDVVKKRIRINHFFLRSHFMLIWDELYVIHSDSELFAEDREIKMLICLRQGLGFVLDCLFIHEKGIWLI